MQPKTGGKAERKQGVRRRGAEAGLATWREKAKVLLGTEGKLEGLLHRLLEGLPHHRSLRRLRRVVLQLLPLLLALRLLHVSVALGSVLYLAFRLPLLHVHLCSPRPHS